MKYLQAYFKAWWILFKASSFLFLTLWLFVGLNNLVALYLFYLICTTALGVPIMVWLEENKNV